MTSAAKTRLEVIHGEIQPHYPRTVYTPDGAEFQFRLMGRGDRDEVLAFARALPEDDLLFLPTDITQAPAIDEWIANIDAGRTLTLLAREGETLAGYVSIVFDATEWMRHLGEIQLLTGRDFRGRGLGRVLALEVYRLARQLGLRRLSAHMSLDQAGARATFERLGFRAEALLTDWVMDAEGETRDLLIMAYDLQSED
ncbi:MAG: GNAT family N-acetyltransferase [Dehalococcoidia bacterium]|nr:GNAT family N-acetyltransferase [Dehalococcoidia bacterium]